MHIRTEACYNDVFMGCRFNVKMKKEFSYGSELYPVMIFCLVPYPEDPVSAFVAKSKLASFVCSKCNEENHTE